MHRSQCYQEPLIILSQNISALYMGSDVNTWILLPRSSW